MDLGNHEALASAFDRHPECVRSTEVEQEILALFHETAELYDLWVAAQGEPEPSSVTHEPAPDGGNLFRRIIVRAPEGVAITDDSGEGDTGATITIERRVEEVFTFEAKEGEALADRNPRGTTTSYSIIVARGDGTHLVSRLSAFGTPGTGIVIARAQDSGSEYDFWSPVLTNTSDNLNAMHVTQEAASRRRFTGARSAYRDLLVELRADVEALPPSPPPPEGEAEAEASAKS